MRKAIPKTKRLEIYEKYNHHCAYCGCELKHKDMQVDHIDSVYLHHEFLREKTLDELNEMDNLMPSCRQCNFYKGVDGIEPFRRHLTGRMMDNLRKNFNYRLALKYGLIEEHIEPVKFYFERRIYESEQTSKESRR